jgi:nicotinamidase/pyrazinamidase
MRSLFFDIDTQVDFMHSGGALYVPHAESIIPNLRLLTRYAVQNEIPIFASADSHTEQHEEFEIFPPHCLRDSAGNRKIPETQIPGAEVQSYLASARITDSLDIPGVIFTKNTYDVFSNPFVLPMLKEFNPDEIIAYGVATDYCVKAAVTSLVGYGFPVTLVSDAVKAVVAADAQTVLGQLRAAGVKIRTTAEIIGTKTN